MQETLSAIVGVLLVLLATVDVIWTTLSVMGWGPVTGLLYNRVWQPRLGNRRSSMPTWLIRSIGPAIIVITLLIWVTMLWSGWALIFNAQRGAVINSATQAPASTLERLYFAGTTLSTLGIGDYVPHGPFWQVLTAMASTSGFFVLTLTVAYIVPILSEVVNGRRVARYISGLGESATDILVYSWNGTDFGMLVQHLVSLSPVITHLGERYLAYPVLHYFYDTEQQAAVTLALATLDEALTLLDFGVAPECRPPQIALQPIRRGIQQVLEIQRDAYIGPADEPPPLPDLQPLREAGIPTVSDDSFRASAEELSERRRLLRGLVSNDAWSWDYVSHSPDELSNDSSP